MVQQDSGESRCSAIHGIRIFGGAGEERDCSSGRCSRAEGEVGIKNETGHEADRPDQGGFVKKDPAERLVSEEHDRGAHIEEDMHVFSTSCHHNLVFDGRRAAG
jgi:hypothetical protein